MFNRSGVCCLGGHGEAPGTIPGASILSSLPLFLSPLPLPPRLSLLSGGRLLPPSGRRSPRARGSAATAGTPLRPCGSEELARLIPARETEGARRCPLIGLVCTPACRCVKRGWLWLVEFSGVKRERDCRTASEMSSGKIDDALCDHGLRAVPHQHGLMLDNKLISSPSI